MEVAPAICIAVCFLSFGYVVHMGAKRRGRDEGIDLATKALVVRLIPLFKAYKISPDEVRVAMNTPIEIVDEPRPKNPN